MTLYKSSSYAANGNKSLTDSVRNTSSFRDLQDAHTSLLQSVTLHADL